MDIFPFRICKVGKILLQIGEMIMRRRIIRLHHGQRIIHLIMGTLSDCGEIGFIREYLVNNRLDIRILGSIYGDSSGIQKIIRFCLRISRFYQIIQNLLDDRIRKIGINRLNLFLIHKVNPFIYVIGKRLIIFLLRTVSELKHIIQGADPAFTVVLGMSNRILIDR